MKMQGQALLRGGPALVARLKQLKTSLKQKRQNIAIFYKKETVFDS